MAAGEALDITYTKDGSVAHGADAGWITVAFEADACTLQGPATLFLTAKATLSGATGIMTIPIPMQARATLRLLYRHGSAQPPNGLGAQMTIITDPYRPEVILDQYLTVWFNGHPQQCQVTLKLDNAAEFQPAWVWQNPGTIQPAILKIDGAEIPGDGRTHRLTVKVWQAVGNLTSPASLLELFAKTPPRMLNKQPEWGRADVIRQGNGTTLADLTRIEWRHDGAVQIIARYKIRSGTKIIYTQTVVGYADYTEKALPPISSSSRGKRGRRRVRVVPFGVVFAVRVNCV